MNSEVEKAKNIVADYFVSMRCYSPSSFADAIESLVRAIIRDEIEQKERAYPYGKVCFGCGKQNNLNAYRCKGCGSVFPLENK
jgi:ribosomal protein L40E